ncbi:MAG: hypothetical protein IKG94_02835 [Candidatus Methanomethylophilaceae archaeon]|nr:hypothetical protein [Candidatus Methanomethylophilaceae archaeon]MBR4225305.1 hypothetical protein [Candidatus Methanomethylophilaceae archaeon]
MKATDVSVHDVWTDDDRLVDMILRRIEDCGRYSPYNPEWQSLSTMIDYALKTTLAKNEKASRIADKLRGIGYVPLSRIASSPSVRLGWLTTSEDGVIGINEYEGTPTGGGDLALAYNSCIDVFLTGICTPIFTVFLLGTPRRPDYAISPDSKKLAILHDNRLTVWGLADCRILLDACVIDQEGKLRIAWSRNSEKVLIYGGPYFRTIDYSTGQEHRVCHAGIDKIDQLVTNDDASEFVYHNGEFLYIASKERGIPRLLNEEVEFYSCYLVRSRGDYWALLDGSAYLVKNDSLEYKGDINDAVDTDPLRFEEIIVEQLTDNRSFGSGSYEGCTAEVDGDEVVFKTMPRLGRTHWLSISADSLDYEKFVGDAEEAPISRASFGDEVEIGQGVSYRIEPRKDRASASLFLRVDGKEHPLGPCRSNAVAAYANGRVFVYRGKTVDVYDRESMRLLKSILAMDTDRWMIYGADVYGTISLVKVEDVTTDFNEGSNAKILFARMKAPDFRLDVYEGCSIELDKIWNLKFSLSVRDKYLFYYKRDGNRVKPLTLNRCVLRSNGMKRSSTMKTDESKFGAFLCGLSGERLAVVSLDNLDENPNAEPRATIRLVGFGDGSSETCDISKKKDGHLYVSGIQDAFVLSEDGREFVVVQLSTRDNPLICSRDAWTRDQFPSKEGYVEGTVVCHDDTACIVRRPDGTYSRFGARLEALEEGLEFTEERKEICEDSGIPLNRELRASFGRIVQNGGAFFCLKG